MFEIQSLLETLLAKRSGIDLRICSPEGANYFPLQDQTAYRKNSLGYRVTFKTKNLRKSRTGF